MLGEGACASLELVQGESSERIIELRGSDLHIGRHPQVGLTLDHPKVSLYHARIERRFDGSYRIVDLMSKNATFVDDVKLKPFEPTPVREASRIRIVDFEFVFHEPTARVGGPTEVAKSTVLGTQVDLSSSGLVLRAADPAEALRGVLDVVRALGGASDLDSRLTRALEGLMAIIPRSERGFVATVEQDGSLPLRAYRTVKGLALPPILSRTIVEEVLRKGRSLLIKDVLVDERFKDRDSLQTSIRTAVCAPLVGGDGRPIGLVQLDGASPKARFREDDQDLLAALAVPIAAAVESDRLMKEQASLAAAAEIQLALLPHARPQIPGYTFWEYYRTAHDVGGDLYDYIPVENSDDHAAPTTRWCITLGDVAGHGMPAALLMAGVCPEVRLLARAGFSLKEMLVHVNTHYYDSGIVNRFITMIAAEVDSTTHQLSIAAAGHPLPLVRRARGGAETLECPGAGPPLGVDPDATYEPSSYVLAPGEVVVLFSDGLIDAVGQEGRGFGLDRLERLIALTRGGAAEVGEAILAALGDHLKERLPLDDVSIVCFSRDAETS